MITPSLPAGARPDRLRDALLPADPMVFGMLSVGSYAQYPAADRVSKAVERSHQPTVAPPHAPVKCESATAVL